MNRDSAIKFMPLLEALVDGKQLQFKTKFDTWLDVTSVDDSYQPSRYRVKPKPVECWVGFNPDMVSPVTVSTIDESAYFLHLKSAHFLHLRWVKMREVIA